MVSNLGFTPMTNSYAYVAQFDMKPVTSSIENFSMAKIDMELHIFGSKQRTANVTISLGHIEVQLEMLKLLNLGFKRMTAGTGIKCSAKDNY